MKRIMVLFLSVLFLFGLIGCSNDQPKTIKSQPVEKHVDNSVSMEDNMKALADDIQEFKTQLSADKVSKDQLQQAVSHIEGTAKEGLDSNIDQDYKDILNEWVSLTADSPFDDANPTKDQIGKWVDDYNVLIKKTSSYIMDRIDE